MFLISEGFLINQTLPEPFSKIFQDVEDAEWAFDLLKDAFNLLNIKNPNDPRFAITLPHNQRVLRLNFGYWAVLQFYGPNYSKTPIALAPRM